MNALDRVTEEIDPLHYGRTYAYDAVGNLVQYTDRDDRVTEYRYDALDRTVGERWLSAAGLQVSDAEYAYDSVGNLLSAADAFSRYSFTYDALDRRLTKDNAGSPGQPHVVLTHAYDAYGNDVLTHDDSGVSVRSGYDARNQLASRSWDGLPGGVSASASFQYDERGLLAAIERFGDAGRTQQVGSTLFDYDALGRISELTHRDPLDQVLAKYDYAWDAASQLTAWTHHGETTNYTHDATGQLTSADGALPEGYTYDAAGNRIGGGQTIGVGNQLLADEQFDYGYDGEGNLVSKTDRASGEVTSYSYDHRNRLVHAETKSAGGIILSQLYFTYDVFDRRIAETVDADGAGPDAAQTTRFVYNGANVWADYDASGQAVARYLFGDGADELLARWTPPAGTAWYLVDHLGTVRDIVNSAGVLIDHIDYDSFGRVLSETNPLAGDRYKFTGREYVPALGLYYYRARFYDPGTGRFLSADPLSFAAGDENLYRYVGNRPLTATDPTGMSELGEFSAFQVMDGVVLGAMVGMVCGAADAAAEGGSSKEIANGALHGAAFGGIFGAFGAVYAAFEAEIIVNSIGYAISIYYIGDAALKQNGSLLTVRTVCGFGGIAAPKAFNFLISKLPASSLFGGKAAGSGGTASRAAGQKSALPARRSLPILEPACFVAGTPILTENGVKAIEDVAAGEKVVCRSEFDPDAPEELQSVTELFTRKAQIVRLRIQGVEIQTTELHPFFVQGRGWTPAGKLVCGSMLSTREGVWVQVDDVARTNESREVFNFSVANRRNYFVGRPEWGFAVWAHNTDGYFLPGVPLPEGWTISTNATHGTSGNLADFIARIQAGGSGFDPARNPPLIAKVLAGETLPLTQKANTWFATLGDPRIGAIRGEGIHTTFGVDIARPAIVPTIGDTQLAEIQSRVMLNHLNQLRSESIPYIPKADAALAEQIKATRAQPLPANILEATRAWLLTNQRTNDPNIKAFLRSLGVDASAQLGVTGRQFKTVFQNSRFSEGVMWNQVDRMAAGTPGGFLGVQMDSSAYSGKPTPTELLAVRDPKWAKIVSGTPEVETASQARARMGTC